MKIKLIFFSVLLVSTINVFSQEVVTPEKAVSLALENNYGIKFANTQVEVAKYGRTTC